MGAGAGAAELVVELLGLETLEVGLTALELGFATSLLGLAALEVGFVGSLLGFAEVDGTGGHSRETFTLPVIAPV